MDAPQTRMFDMAEVPRVLSLAERFTVPPFTVLNSAEGWWQTRKNQWKELGIRSEVGRDARAYGSNEDHSFLGEEIDSISGGQSIFDPVLTELIYRWFGCAGDQVLDVYAGGSVRGVVAAYLERHYTGIDLSRRQIDANWSNLTEIFAHEGGGFPGSCQWVEGDSCFDIPKLIEPESMDLVIGCPPYFNLEVYSDDPRDLSVGTWEEFLEGYRLSIAAAVASLKENRFAVFVVGEIRDKKGNYRGLVPETIRAFQDAGAHFYNESILVTPVGSVRMMVGRQFEASRKLGKRHQQVLCFVRGTGKEATRRMDTE
jgi:hypothetical protein